MAEKHRIRKRQFLINLSDGEMKLLEEKAAKYHMSKAELVRNMILFGASQENGLERYDREAAETLLCTINDIGNHVNEIAHDVNTKCSVEEVDFARLQDEYIRLLSLFEDWAID